MNKKKNIEYTVIKRNRNYNVIDFEDERWYDCYGGE